MMTKRWKFLREKDGKIVSNSGSLKSWQVGKWKTHRGQLDLCLAGFHCSSDIYQAFSYVQGEILAQVECDGKSIISDDKEVWQKMRIIKAYKWQKKDSVALSIFAAELVIENFEKAYPDDRRPREAIEAAKKWLVEPTPKNQEAAWSAARSAESAARSAESAAESAAWSAESARKKTELEKMHSESFKTDRGGYIQFKDEVELDKFRNWLDKLEDDYLDQLRKDIAKARHDERKAVLAEVEGWLDDWIKRNGVEVGIELGLRAKLVEMKEEV